MILKCVKLDTLKLIIWWCMDSLAEQQMPCRQQYYYDRLQSFNSHVVDVSRDVNRRVLTPCMISSCV